MEKTDRLETGFEFLAEKDAMWAEMIIQALKDNGIPCAAMPVHGAGLVMKTGMRERLKIYVAPEGKAEAEDILEALFTGTN